MKPQNKFASTKPAQCVSAINGRLSAPKAISVSETFDKPKQELCRGDILLPSRFNRPGGGIKDSNEGGIYASENIFVIRAADPVVSKFLSIYFSDEVGKTAILALSKAVLSYKSYAINASDLRALALPDFNREQMLKVIEVKEQQLATQAKLAGQTDVLSQLMSDSEQSLAALSNVTERSPVDLEMLQMSKDAIAFLSVAEAAGISSAVGSVKVAIGTGHSMIKMGNDACIVENIETGGLLVVRDGEVLIADGITASDQAKFRQLAEVSVNFLQPSLNELTVSEAHSKAALEME